MSNMTNRKWETDASRLTDFQAFDKFVYRNTSVEEFLLGNSKYFVIAAKGIGKTLLLSYKRYLLEQRYINAANRSSVIFIPEGPSYIGFTESIRTTLSNEQMSRLTHWEFCKKLWMLIIELSAISYSGADIESILSDLPPRSERQKKALRALLSKPRGVDYILNELIMMTDSALTMFFEDISNPIGYAFKRINVPIFMFLDRFDNALEVSHDSIWASIQVGLLEAAWEIMNINAHVKIYLSIRQEAYAEHHSRNMNQISTSVVTIKYMKEELLDLLNHLVNYYENKSSVADFIGFEKFPNTVVFYDEEIFDFMFRYSIGRPRDFVEFCDELSIAKANNSLDLESKRMFLKEKVREVSSKQIVHNLFDELKMLMKCLTRIDEFDRFLSMIMRNILKYNELQGICRAFNGSSCGGNCNKCAAEHHPFCDLYNMGLLGFVDSPLTARDKKNQKFKTPYENLIHGLRTNTDFFVMHPALREYINRLHMETEKGSQYKMMLGILVGESQPWGENEETNYRINKLILGISDEDMAGFFWKRFENRLRAKRRSSFPLHEFNRIRKQNYPVYEQHIIDALVDYFSTGKLCVPNPISIFISYATDCTEHKENVESFNFMLREMGYDSVMDSTLKLQYPDIDEMMTVGLQKDKIIVVLSPQYKTKADNRSGGVWKEFKIIADDLEVHKDKYIFVDFDPFNFERKSKVSPIRIGNRWIVDLAKGKSDDYNELVSFITGEKEYPELPVNQVVKKTVPKPIKKFGEH